MSRRSVIEGLDVRLSRLTRADIQLVRSWRNADNVVPYMQHRETITAEQQERWFASLNDERDFYFIIEYQGRKVGLSSLKNVDMTDKSGEGGLFFALESLRNSLVPYRASLPALDWIYEELGLRSVRATVLRHNRRAIRFNRSLGHVVDEARSNEESVLTEQTRASFREARKKFVTVFGEWQPEPLRGDSA